MRFSGRPIRLSVSATNFSKPQASSTYLRRAFARFVRSPWAMNTRTMASATAVQSSARQKAPVGRARSLWPEMPPMTIRHQTPASGPASSLCSTAWKPMSLVSSSVGMTPPPSKATLNLRGSP